MMRDLIRTISIVEGNTLMSNPFEAPQYSAAPASNRTMRLKPVGVLSCGLFGAAAGALMGLFGLSMLYSFAFWSLGLYRTWHIEPVITPAKIKIYEEVKRVAAGTTSPVLYSGPSISEMYFVSVAGARPVMSLQSDGIYMQNHYHALLNAKILIAGSPVLLLIDVRDKMEKREQFLQIYQPEKLIEYPGGALYQVKVKD